MPHALHSRAGVKEEDLQKWNTALMTSYAGMIFVGSGMWNIGVHYETNASSELTPFSSFIRRDWTTNRRTSVAVRHRTNTSSCSDLDVRLLSIADTADNCPCNPRAVLRRSIYRRISAPIRCLWVCPDRPGAGVRKYEPKPWFLRWSDPGRIHLRRRGIRMGIRSFDNPHRSRSHAEAPGG